MGITDADVTALGAGRAAEERKIRMMRDYPLMTEEQRTLVYLLRDFLKKEVMPHAAEWDEKGEFPLEVYKQLAELGFNAIDVPEEYGGLGCDALTTCLLRQELGYAEAGFAVSFAAATFGIKPVILAGTREQAMYYSEHLAHGGICANCLTEPQSGSDLALTRTTAVRDGDDYIINGTKCFITNGAVANIYTVAASTDPSKRGDGISLFIVERDRPGVSVGKHENKMGIRASNTTDVVFEDVRVPAKNLIGPENSGFETLKQLLAHSRPTGMAVALGIMDRAVEIATRYAKERMTFGKPIAKQQMIKQKLADMQILTQTSKGQVFYNASLLDHGIRDAALGAVTKAFVSENVVKVTDMALQVLGGYGYMKDYPIEKLYRDARIYPIFEGTSEIQRIVIAGDLVHQF